MLHVPEGLRIPAYSSARAEDSRFRRVPAHGATVEQVDELADIVRPLIERQDTSMRERLPARYLVELALRFSTTGIFMLYLFLRSLLQCMKFQVRVTTPWHGSFA